MCFRADIDSLTFPHSGDLSGLGLKNGAGVSGLLAGAQGGVNISEQWCNTPNGDKPVGGWF